ncbi:iron(III) transport system substrate-binding protein [Anaerobranca californiensis DSM 14826]|uniref:Iron(III) transport system substrate-binding protein n=1 Tax=Anaerobranca californiensis DSM 14826 TaxID=1120989 RepID=A0A1M6NXX9_9FIRM|nr:extracellular solute-binding protein [Anaerobranca californiensis]SHK00599.1 iron(III) transport system substrate-binding protein [Anaerobranca californiensis DSM 14826]
MKKILALISLIFVVLVAVGCSQQGGNDTNELVVYSSRNETFVQQLLDKFQDETGITVRALHAGEGVFNRIKEEKNNVQGDIIIANDIGALEHLRMEGLLQGYKPQNVESIPEQFRAEDNSWIALSARTRVFIYNKDLITEEEMPKTVWELTDEKWKGQFAITRGGNGGMIGHVSALRYEWGDEKTSQWLSIIKDNAGAIMQGHGDIRRAVGAGEFKFGLVNNYYYHQQLREPENNNVGVIYPDQGEGEMGAVVNAAGVGFIKGAPNDKNAKIFLDWLLKPENQKAFSYASLEVPINPEIEAIPEAKKISEYKVHGMPLRDLGKYWLDTRQLIEKSGLDLEIR